MQRSHPHRLLPVRRLNDEEAPNHLLGFGIRPVGHLRLDAARAQGKRGLGAFERGARDQLVTQAKLTRLLVVLLS